LCLLLLLCVITALQALESSPLSLAMTGIARSCDWNTPSNRTNLRLHNCAICILVSNHTNLRSGNSFKSHDRATNAKKGTTSIPPLRSLQYIFADMTVLQQTAESKAKAIQEIQKTGFLNYDVLLAHHPDADNHFAGVPSKDAIAYMFNSNMVNGIHALCQYPFLDDYNGPVFPMFLVEHQPMDLTGQLDTDEKSHNLVFSPLPNDPLCDDSSSSRYSFNKHTISSVSCLVSVSLIMLQSQLKIACHSAMSCGAFSALMEDRKSE
jgi:hypothetical protein